MIQEEQYGEIQERHTERNPACVGCGRSVITRFGGPCVAGEHGWCESCESDMERMGRQAAEATAEADAA